MGFFLKIFLILALAIPSAHWLRTPLLGETRVIISSFSTSVTDQSHEVKRNIAMACNRLNGAVIPAGKVFSFNDSVGEGSAKNGFADGLVMYRDGSRMEPGGGLCQVSSTLFNALLAAGAAITERHRHFQPVAYVPLGLDATIKYGQKDLRIINPHSQNLEIKADMNDSSLTIIILGERQIGHTYVIDTEEEEMTLPLSGGSDGIRNGIMVHVYRKKYTGNNFIESTLLYRDFYPPVYRD